MNVNTVRLACGDCDCDQYDGITEEELEQLKTQGWDDVTRIQSYEDSIKTYDDPADAPPGYSVLDWYTHIGTCPDCKETD